MLAFAGNSLLCRAALAHTDIDAASFTAIRLLSGAMMLGLIVWVRRNKGRAGVKPEENGSWGSAFALFAYAACFSYAYLSLSAATGALLLFSAVQAAMLGYGFYRGERFKSLQWLGLIAAMSGVVILLYPGLSAPPLTGSLTMLCAGVAWAVYSLRGSRGGRLSDGSGDGPGDKKADPTRATAFNFIRTLPFAAALFLLALPWLELDAAGAGYAGVGYAMASGAIASGVGYALWYAALPGLSVTSAATVQLSVPVLTAAAGVLMLGEVVDARLVIASVAVLGGVMLVLMRRQPAAKVRSHPVRQAR